MVRYAQNYLKIILLPLAVAALVLGGASTRAADSKTAAPDWQLSDVDGKTVKLSDFKGNVVAAYQGFTDQSTFESVIVPLLEKTQG
jgi:hypothetical protein